MDALTETFAAAVKFIDAVEAGGVGGVGDGSVGLEEGRLGCEEGRLKRGFGTAR